MDKPILQFQKYQIVISYPKGTSRTLLHECDLTLRERKSLIISGASGSGKTLILKSVLHLLPSHFQSAGQIKFFPQTGAAVIIGSLSPLELTLFRRTQVGFLPQVPQTMFSPVHTCGRQLTELLRLLHQIPPRAARELALDRLRQVGFIEPQKVYDYYPHQLSGGMAQRFGLVLALAGSPRLLLIDEPTAALDVIAKREFYHLIAKMRQAHQFALIMVTHDLDIGFSLADQMLVILRGLVCETGPAGSLKSNPRHPYTQLLIETDRQLTEGKSPAPKGLSVSPFSSQTAGCPFGAVCPRAVSSCHTQLPLKQSVGTDWEVCCYNPLP